MKTKHLLLTALLLALAGIFISNYTRDTEKQFSSDEFTPQELWEKQYQEKKAKRKVGYSKANKPDMYSRYFKDITTRIGESESGYQMNYKTLELQKAHKNSIKLKSTKAGLDFIQRGPANVGGRTRAIVVDRDDVNKKTWLVGSATGGIWKTTDGAENWTNLSNDLTNLSVNALVMAKSDPNIIYAGTGESFPGSSQVSGNGIWKSIDRGERWTQLTSTATSGDFSFINRFFVNPINADIVIAATETGIFKTIDGGTVWSQVYESASGVEDLAFYPSARDTIFAGENSKGVLRTVDGGETWKLFSRGLSSGSRYEVAVSPVNRNFVYTSVDISEEASEVFLSMDNANVWLKYNDAENFLGGQGGYDNTIEAHPFIDSVVYVAGVDMWKLAFNKTTTVKPDAVKWAYTENTDFLSFVDFGGSHLNGGLSIDEGTNVLSTDWTSVEIRFGVGLSQKAHRFTVPDEATSGVPAADYTYADYVDVPFQVWDITNNKQLMVSFRDQEKDGAFNLYTRVSDAYGDFGREYIYINAIDYNPTIADPDIAVAGGHLNKALYMIWSGLTVGTTWDPENLPTSKIAVEYGPVEVSDGEKVSVADAYGNHDGPNGYDQNAGYDQTKIPGLHPDHHNITIIPLEGTNFRIVNGNDGGIGVSEDNGVTFNQKPNNYITTQFYGVAKNPEANQYIGGMQDNGTWQSVANEDASSESNYLFRLPGDGFECLWHSKNPKSILGSIYYNLLYKTIDGGANWSPVDGITKDDGPFLTHLSVSKGHPDVVFAIGKAGVYKSTDFGSNWELKAIEENWSDGTVYGQHNVEVSFADPKIVWAGAVMSYNSDLKIHVSQDEGETYTVVKDYADKNMRANISGIATHPTQASTAYLLFSNSKSPKILRTTDLGENWEDISGFGTGEVSTNGFPDVVTHSLLVMPNDPNIIWAGTEIGLFESTDDGVNWHPVVGNLPPVSIYDMHIVGNQVVFATHGRGVWSVDILEIDRIPEISEFKEVDDKVIELTVDVKVDYDSLEIYLNGIIDRTIDTPEKGEQSFSKVVDELGIYKSYVIGYIGDETFKSGQEEVEVKDKTPEVTVFEVIEEHKLNLGVEIPVLFDKFEIYINDEIYKTVSDPEVGSTDHELYVEESGTYSVYIIGYIFDTSYQSNTKEVEMIITGIETIQEEVDEMKIYPNPCRNEFELLLGNLTEVYTLEIIDLSGKIVYSQKEQNVGNNTIRFGLLKAGFYIVRVTMDDKVVSSKIQVIK